MLGALDTHVQRRASLHSGSKTHCNSSSPADLQCRKASHGRRSVKGSLRGAPSDPMWLPKRWQIASTSDRAPQTSSAERLIEELEELGVAGENGPGFPPQMEERIQQLKAQAAKISQTIDAEYLLAFQGIEVEIGREARTFPAMTEEGFAYLGRDSPTVMKALLGAKPSKEWQEFQSKVRPMKLQRSRLLGEAEELSSALYTAAQEQARNSMHQSQNATYAVEGQQGGQQGDSRSFTGQAGAAGGQETLSRPVRIVLITGFESFNVDLYKRAAEQVRAALPLLDLQVFSDRDISTEKSKMQAALSKADVFFGSLLFDYDQVEWVKSHISHIPVRLVFESALELMSCTQVGSFNMAPSPSGQKQGPPPVVKKVLSLFGSQREEDKMVGYLSFLKVGPKLLKWLPGQKAADLKHWLTIYGYWNQGGLTNVVSMLLYMVDALITPLPLSITSPPSTTPSFSSSPSNQSNREQLLGGLQMPWSSPTSPSPCPSAPGPVTPSQTPTLRISPPVETPPLGCLHPLYGGGQLYFNSPHEYMAWYQTSGPLRGQGAPIVGVLLYRKHVITEQPYIAQLITQMEEEGLLPVPIFINGVEAHTVVRDLLTSESEQKALAQGRTGGISSTLSRDAVKVDAVVSTIGFPLVGGPAGSMEGGRQADVAKAILTSKNVPYTVAAPLLIQDMASWVRDGIAGLQSVVLYSLPELDGAVDTVPLGGLVGDSIFLVPERVKKMAGRIRGWVNLRRKPAHERRVAVMLYGFPPGVGATGTAALLNVPKSLSGLMTELKAAGYDLGLVDPKQFDGEALISALAAQDEQRAISRGAAGVNALGAKEASHYGVQPAASEVTSAQLKSWLTYPPEWGPTEWGPIPFLPDHDTLVKRMEKQWGDLQSYRGISTSATGSLVVPGLQAGNVFVGVQPALGLEGDPMRLLFERDLTPHPQYAAYYKWLQQDFKADVILHFGMHGTVEWLPGAPLGNTGLSWSDVLMGELPNVYVYAANNPSESIIAKRRGYGTIISHNVPPYGRAGLYKQLATLKELISEDREARTSVQQRNQQAEAGGGGLGAAALGMGAPQKAMAASATQASVTATMAADSAASVGMEGSGAGGSSIPTSLRAAIVENMRLAGLQDDVPYIFKNAGQQASSAAAAARGDGKGGGSQGGDGVGKALTTEAAEALSEEEWGEYMSQVYTYLGVLENRLFSEGLHVLGAPPSRQGMVQYLSAFFDGALPEEALELVAGLTPNEGAEAVVKTLERIAAVQKGKSQRSAQLEKVEGSSAEPEAMWWAGDLQSLVPKLEEAVEIRGLLERNTEELQGVVRALGGEYIEPEAGGDLLRDGAGVLPTGRNIHALDPYRMPSPAAMERGAALAEAIIAQHRATNDGAYPQTCAVNLWGLDAIKTKGESVGIVLALVGARPLKEATGRVARYELLPLDALGGRPRIDVLCNMSGIFRDSFQNVVELLDDLFQRAATAADEPEELNFIKAHATAMEAKGLKNTAARLFSNPAGDYGSMVNERIGSGGWENGDELGDTWASRNAFSYGRGKERGTARPEILQSLLSTTDRVVQEVDSVEYGLTDIQEYYANTGALQRAAQVAQGGKSVRVSIVEAFGKDVKPRELDEVLRLEYRSKLLNPKWAEAMSNQGSGGAYEISQRMTAMVGWGATSGFSEKWVWDQAADSYALDSEMANKLRKANPQAFANVLRRMLEAAGRGMWDASPEVLARLRSLYGEMDDQLEGVTSGSPTGTVKGPAPTHSSSKTGASGAKTLESRV